MPQATKKAMFAVSGTAYNAFMGRHSSALAPLFADFLGVEAGQRVLDVGCGPGPLTEELAHRVGVASVAACDPSPSFVAACAALLPGVDVREASAEHLPFHERDFDVVASQLVLHFVSDPEAAGREAVRVCRPGGIVGAAVWDVRHGMRMLRVVWDAAADLDPDAESLLSVASVGRPGDVAAWLERAGCHEVSESEVEVRVTYAGFDELWSTYLVGVGPVGVYVVSLSDERREALRQAVFRRLGAPDGAITLDALARVGKGRAPLT